MSGPKVEATCGQNVPSEPVRHRGGAGNPPDRSARQLGARRAWAPGNRDPGSRPSAPRTAALAEARARLGERDGLDSCGRAHSIPAQRARNGAGETSRRQCRLVRAVAAARGRCAPGRPDGEACRACVSQGRHLPRRLEQATGCRHTSALVQRGRWFWRDGASNTCAGVTRGTCRWHSKSHGMSGPHSHANAGDGQGVSHPAAAGTALAARRDGP